MWVFLFVSVVLAGAAWLALTPLSFPLHGTRPVRHEVTTADGWTLSVWHRAPAQRRYLEPVVLCHGLANNAAFMEFVPEASLAQYLAEQGFECYSVNLRGAGQWRGPDMGPLDASFDDHVRGDLPAIIDFVRRQSGQQQLFWVGHSMGGLVGLVGAGSTGQEAIRGLVTVGAPLFFRYHWQVRTAIKVARAMAASGWFPMRELSTFIAPMAGRVRVVLPHSPANLDNISPQAQRVLLAHVFAPIWRGVLAQLEDWVDHDVFRSRDRRVDYRELVKALKLPLLVVGGSADTLAPLDNTEAYYDLSSSPDRTLVLLGKRFGQREEYGHGDLLIGKHARDEVFPRIAAWLAQRATKS